jgi:diguanylate cyclase (GGDEF)-like protein
MSREMSPHPSTLTRPQGLGGPAAHAAQPGGRGTGRETALGLLLIAAVAALLVMLVMAEVERRKERAVINYAQSSAEEARLAVQGVNRLFHEVYQDLRTLAALPGVRAVDRHGKLLVRDSRETFQQIYNNLASAVDVSEVYLIPRDFDPERTDPATGKPEEPIVMFDELIVDSASRAKPEEREMLVADAHEEIEIHEYREFAQQVRWMAQHYPRRETIEGMNVPFIGSKSLVTCDNRHFMHTGLDADRSGVLLSVPFYGPDGNLKGLVAAVVLNRALAASLPARNAVLLNKVYGFLVHANMADVEGSRVFFENGTADPALKFSASFDLDIADARGTWSVWVGRPNSDFFESYEARAVRTFMYIGLAVIAVLSSLAAAIWVNFQRSQRTSSRLAHDLEEKVRQRTEDITRLAMTDSLTSLPNRAMMQQHLEHLSQPSLACAGYAVLCIDLDRLKLINDTLGHRAGDTYLMTMADRMREAADGCGMVARWGGDEFIITVEGRRACDNLTQVAQNICQALGKPIQLGDHFMVPSGSIGIAQAPSDGTDGTVLLARADRALYRAKAAGRGRVMHFDAALDERHTDRAQLELDMRHAVEHREFVVHYQPVVSAASAELVGFEALVRWNHPIRGLLPPGEFITIAEETGLIADIGELVLSQACQDALTWPDSFGLAVNLSPVQVYNPNLCTRVAAILSATGLPPRRLELEITESVFLTQAVGVIERIVQLRAMGIRFALDDFGTGYCSIGYLNKVAVDRIKIDRSFVADLSSTETALPIIKAVAQLASGLNMQVTAEGVETHEQAEKLQALGISHLQGYHFGKPMPYAVASVLARAAAAVSSAAAEAPELAAGRTRH